MKKIGVFLDSEPYTGGTFQYNQAILDALNAMDSLFYIIVAIYTHEAWQEYLKKYSFEFYEVKFDLDLMPRKIDNLKCDLIICPSQEGLPELLTTPTIGTIHDLMHRYERRFPEVSGNGEYEARERRYTSICAFSSGILVDSELGKKQVLESYGTIHEEKIFVLPFTPPKYLFDWMKNDAQEVNGNEKEKYIFYPAQFWLHKNHKNLILAIAKLKEKGINVKLVFVGAPKNGFDEVDSLIGKLNLEENIEILGYVSDKKMCSLYKNARAMIMPTFFGPTNIPPLEGFLMGCPVAVSNIYAMPEQVADAALLFDPNDIDEIADVLSRLWFDNVLCKDLVQRGYERVKHFSADIFNKNLNEIIEKVLQLNQNKKRHRQELVQFCQKYNDIYLYGAGEYGYWLRIILASQEIKPKAFIVTNKSRLDEKYLDLPVHSIGELLLEKGKCGIILSLDEKHHEGIEEILKSLEIQKEQIYKIQKSQLKEINSFFATVQGKIQRALFEKTIK